MSRITAEVNALGTFGYSYVDDVSGSSKGTLRLSSISYPNSQTTNFNWYPNAGDQRLQQISNLDPTGAVLSQFNYVYDSAGQITQWQQQQNGNNLFNNFGYDAAGQLTSSQVGSGSPQPPFAQENYYAYDPASNRTSAQATSLATARVGGSVTAGDVLTVTVNDVGLSGGPEAVSYTTQSGDTLPTVAAQLAAAINADTNLQTLGVVANANGSNTFVNIRSVSSNVTTYAPSTSGGATESLAFGIFKNGVENAVIAGTKTTGDVLTITVNDQALSGGLEAVSYTVLSGDNINSIAAALASAINADTSLATLGVTATSASAVVSISSISTNSTTYSSTTSGGATESIALAMNSNVRAVLTFAGSPTTSDTITVNVFDSGLSGGTEAVPYTVTSGATLSSIASGIAAAINADTSLQNIGASASSSGDNVTIQSNSPNATSYRESTSTGATELVNLTIPSYGWQIAALNGTATSGDVLSINVFDGGLSGGTETISYSVTSGDDLTSIASGLASAINADTNLSAIGVSATSLSTVVNIESLSNNLTTLTQSLSAGATETIALGSNIGSTSAFYNSVNELTNLAPGGGTAFQGTANKSIVKALTYTPVISIAATPEPFPTYSQAITGAVPSETMTVGSNDNGNTTVTLGGTGTVGDTLSITYSDARLPNGPVTVSLAVVSSALIVAAPDLAAAFTPSPIGLTATSSGTVISIQNDPTQVNSTVYTASASTPATETISLGTNTEGSVNTTIGGTVTPGDTLTIYVSHPSLPGGQEAVSYTTMSGDTTTDIATAFASAMTADANLAAIGLYGYSSGAVISTYFPGTLIFPSTGTTETLTVEASNNGNTTITVGGTPTSGDFLYLFVSNSLLPGGYAFDYYIVQPGDTLTSIALSLASAVNSDTNLQAFGMSATSWSRANQTWSNQFSANAQVLAGQGDTWVLAEDAGSNFDINTYQISANGGASPTMSYDANGNLISDGTNSYIWDAENRLLLINYPGGNGTSFNYDGLGRNVFTTESVGGTFTSTQFVWCGNQRCEARDGLGTITAQYFSGGETLGGTSYYFTKDHLGSTREMTDGSGVIQGQLAYDAYGRASQLQGSIFPDMQYAGYYFHAPSGLSLTRTRQYSPGLGRWINRDPIEEQGGANLYDYVSNRPTVAIDPSGTLNFGPAGPVGEALAKGGETVIAGGGPEDPFGDALAIGVTLGTLIWEIAKLKDTEHQAYHIRCDEPPPPGLDACATAKWILQRAIDCVNMRRAFIEKWGSTPGSLRELAQSAAAINNAREQVRIQCRNQCKKPAGI